MSIRRIWPTGWRAIVLLIVGSVMGANLIAPAVAHVGGWTHNWTEHIKPRVRSFGDPRWVNGKEQAYARVLRSPSVALDTSRTKNFSAVTRPSTGNYCLTPAAGIDPASRAAVATPEWGNSAGADLEVFVYANAPSCASGQFQVITHQAGAASNNVAFYIFVP